MISQCLCGSRTFLRVVIELIFVRLCAILHFLFIIGGFGRSGVGFIHTVIGAYFDMDIFGPGMSRNIESVSDNVKMFRMS